MAECEVDQLQLTDSKGNGWLTFWLTNILSDLQIDIPTGWGTDYLKRDLGDLNGARVLINRLTHRLVGSRNNWLTDLLSDL